MWKINRQANSSVITPVSYQEWNGDNRSSWMAFLHRNKVSFCCWSLVHVPKQIIHPVLVYFLELYSSCQFILQLLVWNLNFNLGWVPDRRMADCLGDRLSILFIYPVGLFQRQSQVKMFTLNASEYLRYQQVNLWQPQPLDGHIWSSYQGFSLPRIWEVDYTWLATEENVSVTHCSMAVIESLTYTLMSFIDRAVDCSQEKGGWLYKFSLVEHKVVNVDLAVI